MNIKDIISEEVRTALSESGESEVTAGLEQIVAKVPSVIPELEKFVKSNLMAFLEKSLQGAPPLSEAEEDLGDKIAGDIQGALKGAGEVAKGVAKGTAPLTVPALKVAGHIGSYLPFGKKAGILIAAALDETTSAPVRNAILFALGNLIAGSLGLDLPDLGNLIQEIPEELWEILPFTDDNQEWDWGVFNAVDDAALGMWAYKKMLKSGMDPKEQLKRFGDFIGRSDLVPAPEGAQAAPDAPSPADVGDMSLDAKAARVKAAQEKGRGFKGVKEMKIKTSQLYKIIQEELEVVLTNEEAKEIFDLDMSALLDEMTTVSTDDLYLAELFDTSSNPNPDQRPGAYRDDDSGSKFLKSKGHDPETAAPFKGTKTKRGAAKHQRRKEKPVGKEIEELEETEDKSFSKAGEEIKEKGTEGVFTAKADKAGMGVQAYAAKVLKKGSKASTKTKRQAAFAKGAATVARENK